MVSARCSWFGSAAKAVIAVSCLQVGPITNPSLSSALERLLVTAWRPSVKQGSQTAWTVRVRVKGVCMTNSVRHLCLQELGALERSSLWTGTTPRWVLKSYQGRHAEFDIVHLPCSCTHKFCLLLTAQLVFICSYMFQPRTAAMFRELRVLRHLQRARQVVRCKV